MAAIELAQKVDEDPDLACWKQGTSSYDYTNQQTIPLFLDEAKTLQEWKRWQECCSSDCKISRPVIPFMRSNSAKEAVGNLEKTF